MYGICYCIDQIDHICICSMHHLHLVNLSFFPFFYLLYNSKHECNFLQCDCKFPEDGGDMEYVAFHYIVHATTTKSCAFSKDEAAVRTNIQKWLSLCSKQDRNVLGTYLVKKRVGV